MLSHHAKWLNKYVNEGCFSPFLLLLAKRHLAVEKIHCIMFFMHQCFLKILTWWAYRYKQEERNVASDEEKCLTASMNYIFGVCAVLPHLAVYFLAAETPQETWMLPGDGLNRGRTLLVPVCKMSQSCSSGSVVCCPCSGVCPFLQRSPRKVQSLKGFAGIVTLLFFLGAYSMYVLGLLLLLWDSALSSSICMVFPKWGCLTVQSPWSSTASTLSAF